MRDTGTVLHTVAQRFSLTWRIKSMTKGGTGSLSRYGVKVGLGTAAHEQGAVNGVSNTV